MNPVTNEYICRSAGCDTVKTENGAHEPDCVATKVEAYLSVRQTFCT